MQVCAQEHSQTVKGNLNVKSNFDCFASISEEPLRAAKFIDHNFSMTVP